MTAVKDSETDVAKSSKGGNRLNRHQKILDSADGKNCVKLSAIYAKLCNQPDGDFIRSTL